MNNYNHWGHREMVVELEKRDRTAKSIKIIIKHVKELSKHKWGFFNQHSEYFKEISTVEKTIT